MVDAQYESDAVVECLADVTAKPVTWLWPNVLPAGKLTVLAGDPGLGKSFVTLDIASRVSSGRRFPRTKAPTHGPGTVVLMSAEDGLADTIKPRLEAMHANCTNIVALKAIRTNEDSERPFSLDCDVERLEAEVARRDAKLVIVDPMAAYLGDVNSHVDSAVRGVLAPLATLAEDTGCAVILVAHMNKAQAMDVIYRACGSIGFIAAPRMAWGIVKDRSTPSKRLMMPIKANLVREPAGIAFRIKDGRVVWSKQPVTVTTAEAYAFSGTEKSSTSAKQRAVAWLRGFLASGPRPAAECKRAAKAEGIKTRTLDRAKDKLRVQAIKRGFSSDSCWMWELPKGAKP